jgi:predicted ArsR family transcriptional regulator
VRHYSGEKATRILAFVTAYGPCWVHDIASALDLHHNVVTFHGKRMSQLTHYHTTDAHPRLFFARKGA